MSSARQRDKRPGRHKRSETETPTRISNGVTTYQLGAEIGRGGFGTVFQALNMNTGDFVAVKRLDMANMPKEEFAGIEGEIDLLKKLNHPNIVKYIDTIRTTDYLHIVLEYMENGSLSGVCEKFGNFSESLTAIYITQVLEGLNYLHEQGVLHRDIKGANILTTKDGQVRLADFGVAMTLGGEGDDFDVVGTPYWMAPEIIEMSPPTSASDIWSVGCTIIELLSGKPPYFDLQPMAALFHIVQDDHPPLPDSLSEALTDFLLKCFKKEPPLRKSAKHLLNHPWLKHTQDHVDRVQEEFELEDAKDGMLSDQNDEFRLSSHSSQSNQSSYNNNINKDKISNRSNSINSFDSDADTDDGTSAVMNTIRLYASTRNVNSDNNNNNNNNVSIKKIQRGSTTQQKLRLYSEDDINMDDFSDNDDFNLSDNDNDDFNTINLNNNKNNNSISNAKPLTLTTSVPKVNDKKNKLNNNIAGEWVEDDDDDWGDAFDDQLNLNNSNEQVKLTEISLSGFEGGSKKKLKAPTRIDTNKNDKERSGSILAPTNMLSRFQENDNDDDFGNDLGLLGSQNSRKPFVNSNKNNNNNDLDFDLEFDDEFGDDFGNDNNNINKNLLNNKSFAQKLQIKLTNNNDNDDDDINNLDEHIFDEFDELDLGHNPERENQTKLVKEVVALFTTITHETDLNDDSIIARCDRLVNIFKSNDGVSDLLLSQEGISPIFQLLGIRKQNVLPSIVRVINAFVSNNEKIQDHLALCGFIPLVISLTHILDLSHNVSAQFPMITMPNNKDDNKSNNNNNDNNESNKNDQSGFSLFGKKKKTLKDLKNKDNKNKNKNNNSSDNIYHSQQKSSTNIFERRFSDNQGGAGLGSMLGGGLLDLREPTSARETKVLLDVEISRFICNICKTSNLALQMFIGCGGLALLVQFVNYSKECANALQSEYEKIKNENDDNINKKKNDIIKELQLPFEILYNTIECIDLVFHLKTSRTRDFCVIFVRHGLLKPLAHAFSFAFLASLSKYIIKDDDEEDWDAEFVELANRNATRKEYWRLVHLFSSILIQFSRSYVYDMSIPEVLESIMHAIDIIGKIERNLPIINLTISIIKRIQDIKNRRILLESLLKCVKNISLKPTALDSLERANAMSILISILDLHEEQMNQDDNNNDIGDSQIFQTIFNLCRIDKKRQTNAAVLGIIPHLKKCSKSYLKQFALPIINDLAHASDAARNELWKNDCIEFYLDLLKENYWQFIAFQSLTAWISADLERVEPILLESSSIYKIIQFFISLPSSALETNIQKFNEILNKSNAINQALGLSSLFMNKLIERLKNTKEAIVKKILLEMIKILVQKSTNPKEFILEHNLYAVVLEISKIDQSQILVIEIINILLFKFNQAMGLT